MNTRADPQTPAPPDELDGEALLEWHRIVGELRAAGQLAKADRAILTLYVETWAVNRAATIGVTRFGAVIKYPNGMTGQSPFFKTQKESAAQLRVLLADLGMTPAARAKNAQPAPVGELEF